MQPSTARAPAARLATALCCFLLALLCLGPGAEAASAAKWHIARIPLPAGASSASFDAVACVGARECWAVGVMSVRHRGDRALAEHFSGRSWRAVPVPSPRALGATELTGIACPRASSCFAVGTRGTGQGGTLVERWNGHAWSVQKAPDPSASALDAVSCPSPTDCLAVGNSGSFDSTGIFNYSLNLHWSGRTWAAEPYNVTGTLTGVSCPSTAFCAAVGYLADSAGYQSSAEQWNGSSVSDVSSGDGNSIEPQAISCPSSAFCMSVGTDQGDFVSIWNGRRWSFRGSPGGLDTVWCESSRLCLAAGARGNRAGVERWNGNRWSAQATAAAQGTNINGLTCASPSACVAVGFAGSDPLALRYR